MFYYIVMEFLKMLTKPKLKFEPEMKMLQVITIFVCECSLFCKGIRKIKKLVGVCVSSYADVVDENECITPFYSAMTTEPVQKGRGGAGVEN